MKYINLKLESLQNIDSIINYLGNCICTVTINRCIETRKWELTISGGLTDHKDFSVNALCCNIGMLIANSSLRVIDLPDIIIHTNKPTTTVVVESQEEMFTLDDEIEPVEIDG
jgi:hypothetical protein